MPRRTRIHPLILQDLALMVIAALGVVSAMIWLWFWGQEKPELQILFYLNSAWIVANIFLFYSRWRTLSRRLR